MDDASDYQLNRTQGPDPPVREPRGVAAWIIAILALLAAGVAIWYFSSGRTVEPLPVGEIAPPTTAPVATTRLMPLCAAAERADVPPLNASDPLVQKLGRSVSRHPRIAAWLATDDVIRSVAVAVDNIANGTSPAPRFRGFEPSGEFRATEKGSALLIDARSFERYNPIADAFDSIDPLAAARLCATLKPRLVEAYAELGRPESFDVALERAILVLLRAPAVGTGTRLVPEGGVYAFEDEALESLSGAQKQIARMGPRNVRIIQNKLRQIAIAIGIPAERLPPPGEGLS